MLYKVNHLISEKNQQDGHADTSRSNLIHRVSIEFSSISADSYYIHYEGNYIEREEDKLHCKEELSITFPLELDDDLECLNFEYRLVLLSKFDQNISYFLALLDSIINLL